MKIEDIENDKKILLELKKKGETMFRTEGGDIYTIDMYLNILNNIKNNKTTIKVEK